MSALPLASQVQLGRKGPLYAQYNWITGGMDVVPEQLELDLPPVEDVELPDDGSVILLATENGSQLFVSGFGLFIGKKGERLVVKKGKETCAQLPLMRVQEVVVASRGVTFSSDLVEELCQRGIRLACLTTSGRPFALLTSPLLTATVATRRAQFDAYEDSRGADICRWVVAGKIHNQEKLLRYFAKSREGERRTGLEAAAASLRKLRRSALAIEGDSADAVRPALMGLEGTAGRIYWQRIEDMLPVALGFQGRKHQGARDAVNAMLNYGYGILYAHVWGAVMNAGLEPFAGFLHVDRPGKPSLVLDLVEEFRQPVVDRAVIAHLNTGAQVKLTQGMLEQETRKALVERVMERLQATETYQGKRYQVRSIIQMQARRLASFLRGDGPYKAFTFKW